MAGPRALQHRRRSAVPVVGVAAIVLLLAGPLPAEARAPVGPAATIPNTLSQFDRHVQHIIVIVLENRAYDTIYGSYCKKVGPFCSVRAYGIPKGTCVPLDPANLTRGCVAPFAFTAKNDSVKGALPHDANSSVQSYNNGSMNGFYLAEHSGLQPFGYYTGSSNPIYFDLAEQYSLDDAFFSSTLSYSLPNHWHLVAGQSPPAVQWGLINKQFNRLVANRSLYLNEANATRSVQDSLLNSSASWRWYDYPIGSNYSSAIGSLNTTKQGGIAFSLWNPQAAKSESYNASFSPHYVNNSQFYADAAAGALPNVSWLIPYSNESDHAPELHSTSESWVASVVDAVESSPEWNTSAIFLTWDDYGGFYDHVAPPIVGGVPLGFRVPLVAIGPYVRENFVSHKTGYLESLLRLIELRFHLPCFTAMDCNAQVPLGLFNFSAPARAPILFPTNVSLAGYPMALQGPMAIGGGAPFAIPRAFLTPAGADGYGTD